MRAWQVAHSSTHGYAHALSAGPLTTPSAKLAAVKRLARRAPSAAASAVQTPAGAGSGHQQRAAGGAGAASVRSSTSQLPNPTFGPTPAAASPQPPTRGGGGGVGGTAAAHGQAQAERKAAAQQAARLVEQKVRACANETSRPVSTTLIPQSQGMHV